ncbi:hypothetical protein [Porphyrobacter sp. YT40]|uniref:hypothetical protein n=1 Tax=Porphyrobacter sp. YT40 TaxID=2547601 RepID=UPI0011439244|nr:hypothetical protein [Porphyrobacter sp. YT40]QDH34486.1 hypothetical protein E2E27_09225 [Porphyrobacter sp. YT40]
MDHRPQISERPAPALEAIPPRPALSLVTSRFALAVPPEPAPQGWAEGLERLLGWLGIDADMTALAQTPRRLPRMAGWALPGGASAPLFAPWTGWSPVAFQHGGLPGLPKALFAASYLIDHPRGQAGARGGVDCVLMSPHPTHCLPEDAGGPPLPSSRALAAMIHAAQREGRERLAIILTARQRNAVAKSLLAAGKGLKRDGMTLDILTLEDALGPLTAGPPVWDAIIAMPDLRGTVFTLLAASTNVRGAWPMLWHGAAGERALVAVTGEAPGEGVSRLPLDAAALIHALALTLHHGGAARAAARLHDGWARLRDSGVTTPRCGDAAPYVKAVDDAAFLDLLCSDAAVSKRAQQPWRALGNEKIARDGSQMPHLRVVTTYPATPSEMKGR